MLTFKEFISEGNPLARVHKHAQDGRHFVGISAQRGNLSKKDNEARHKELKGKLKKQGYGYKEVEGRWEGGKEKSILVHAKGVGSEHGKSLRKDMKSHAKSYDQDAILHHDGKKAKLHGTNDSGYPGKGKVKGVGKIKYNKSNAEFQTGFKKKGASFTTESNEIMDIVLTEEQYENRLQEFLKSQGSNPADNFYGALSWYATKRDEFNEMLRSEGFDIEVEEITADDIDEEE